MPIPEEDQRARSDAILASISGLEERLMLLDPQARSIEWTTLDRGRQDMAGAQAYELINGQVSLGFRLFDSQDFLSWYSDRPGFLKMGESMDDYLKFLEFSLETLPEMLFGPESGASQGIYVPDSTATLKHRSIRKDVTYHLGLQKDRIKLVTDLNLRPKLYENLTILGNRPDGANSFAFISVFPQSSPGSLLSIGVNKTDSTPAVWNPLVAEWVLGTHLDRDKLGDLTQTSANLAAQIGQIKSPAVES